MSRKPNTKKRSKENPKAKGAFLPPTFDPCYYIGCRYSSNGARLVVAKSGSGKLTSAMLHILLSLAEGDKHGYAVMQDVRHLSNGRINIGPGTLYGAIKRMLESGLIEESGYRPDPAVDDGRRRYYRLSTRGRQIVEAEVDRLGSLVQQARARGILGRSELQT